MLGAGVRQRVGSPNSNGFIFELNWLPFLRPPLSFWPWFNRPWFNSKFTLQYTLYREFNGGRTNYDGFRRKAADHNTLFLQAWTAF